MGVLVIYRIELTSTDLLLLGRGIDLLPHGEVKDLVKRVQEQIGAQEAAQAAPIESIFRPETGELEEAA